MTNVVIVGDTVRSADLRHEVPISVPDPFLYAETGGKRYAVAPAMEVARLRELPGLEALPPEEFGFDELMAKGLDRVEIGKEVRLRALRSFGIESAIVPPTFPLEVADHLRANGIDLTADRRFFEDRRRVKNEFEIAGIRRAQKATEAAMATARDILRRAKRDNGGLTVDGEVLTSELLKSRIGEVFNAHDVVGEDMIVSHGPQSAIGHDDGSGAILPDEPIVFDLYPRDRASGCYADMTRTFVVGTPSDEVVEYQRLCLEALQRALGDIRAGVECKSIHDGTCDIFEAAGYPTLRTKEHGKALVDGFYHSLGHGVGLAVHEQPLLGPATDEKLLSGDVVTVEPGLYRQGMGGVRLEDLVLVTEAGAENLTDFPYDLAP